VTAGRLARSRKEGPGSRTPGGRLRRGLIWAGLLTLLGVTAVLALPGLQRVQQRLHAATPGWLAAAVLLELLSCLCFVATFRLVFPLVSRRLGAQIAWTEMAFGAVVPLGGAGGMTVGAWILHEKGVSLRLVAMRSGVLFLLTSAINVIVLALGGLGLGTGLLSGRHALTLGLVPAAVAVVVLAVVSTADFWGKPGTTRRRLTDWITSTTATIRMTRTFLLSPDWKLLAAFGYLLFDVAVLWACFRAIGAHPPIAAIVMGYQIGYLANLVPVPVASARSKAVSWARCCCTAQLPRRPWQP
jgi:uncharacterized membrane protein YbhN (UPF0104 family)